MANRFLSLVRTALDIEEIDRDLVYEAPPEVVRESPGGSALFMDENEQDVLYVKPWPYTGCPQDERTSSTTWKIDGITFVLSRFENGNWIFRRER